MKIERKPREIGIAAEAMEMATKRTLKVTALVEIEVDEFDEYELEDVIRNAGAAAEKGLTEDEHLYLGNVHGTASSATWVTVGFQGEFASFEQACQDEGFPV
jgi:hypothetical protein